MAKNATKEKENTKPAAAATEDDDDDEGGNLNVSVDGKDIVIRLAGVLADEPEESASGKSYVFASTRGAVDTGVKVKLPNKASTTLVLNLNLYATKKE